MDIIPQDTPQQQCCTCEEWKPLTSEYFYPNKAYKCGYKTKCIKCLKDYNAAYEVVHREERAQYRAEQYVLHHEERIEYATKWRAAHPELKQTYTEDQLEQRREYNRQWRVSNPTYQSEHDRTHREQRRVRVRNRAARKNQSQGCHTAQDIERQLKAQKNKCYYCHEPLDKYHVDHIVPLSRGGSNGPGNLVIACPTCNVKKGSKMLHEWIEGGRLL